MKNPVAFCYEVVCFLKRNYCARIMIENNTPNIIAYLYVKSIEELTISLKRYIKYME